MKEREAGVNCDCYSLVPKPSDHFVLVSSLGSVLSSPR